MGRRGAARFDAIFRARDASRLSFGKRGMEVGTEDRSRLIGAGDAAVAAAAFAGFCRVRLIGGMPGHRAVGRCVGMIRRRRGDMQRHREDLREDDEQQHDSLRRVSPSGHIVCHCSF